MPAGPRLHPIGFAALAVGVVALAACGSTKGPKDARATVMSPHAPEPFADTRVLLLRLGALRDGGDSAGARALYPEILADSRKLLTMGPPSDLKQESVARFLDARAAYAQSLNAFGRGVAGTDDAALWSSSKELESAFWAWFDAYRGKPSEGAV